MRLPTSSLRPAQLWPCQRGEVMARQAPCQTYLQQFRSLISSPPAIYRDLYLTTLYGFMELCQALPYASQPSAELESYSLLKRAFSLAMAVLQCRRGWMMPSHSNSEQIAAQEPRWTYALLTTALFRAIPADWQTAYTVGLYKNEQERLGIWHPLTGSLAEPATFYRLEEEESLPSVVEASLLRAAWIGRVIPAVALRWLVDSSSVFSVWWEAISQPCLSAENNSLIKAIHEVAEKLGMGLGEPVGVQTSVPVTLAMPGRTTSTSPESNSSMTSASPSVSIQSPPISSQPSPSKQALIRLHQWLDARAANLTDRPFMRVEKGLLIEIEVLHRLMAQYTDYASLEALLALLTEFLVVDDSNQMIVCYRSVRFERRDTRKGMVLAEAYLPGWLKEWPLYQDFILDYSSTT